MILNSYGAFLIRPMLNELHGISHRPVPFITLRLRRSPIHKILIHLTLHCVMEDNEREKLYSTPTTDFLQVFTQKRVQCFPLVIFHHTCQLYLCRVTLLGRNTQKENTRSSDWLVNGINYELRNIKKIL